MARVVTASWRETYRGLMPDAVLDDPGLENRRIEFWTAILTEQRFADHRSAVAVADGRVVGAALSAPPASGDAEPKRILRVLYLLAVHHGSGAGARLLDAVVRPDEPARLWVADPNPRAQAFYRRHGFRAVGADVHETGMRELCMERRHARP